MNVRFQKTAKGEVAILPRKEYEALAVRAAEADEDAGTARLVARARREISAGTPLIPLEQANRIANGEHPTRVLRQWRGMTQAESAATADITQGYLSDLEGRRRKGSMTLLRAIAGTLHVPLDVVVDD